MNSARTTILSLILFCASSFLLPAQYCIGGFRFVESELGNVDSEELVSEDNISFDEEEFLFRDERIAVDSTTYVPFANKQELIAKLGCFYDYSNCDILEGTIIHLSLAEAFLSNKELTIVELNDCGTRRFWVLTERGFYRAYSVPEIDREEKPLTSIKTQRASSYDSYFVVDVDTTGFVEVEELATYAPVEEIVLEKSGYDSLALSAAVFDTIWIEYINESSSCTEAVMEPITVVHTKKEAYKTYELDPPKFEKVTEEIISEDEPLYYYKREWKDTVVTLQDRVVSYSPAGFSSEPDGICFFDHLLLDSLVEPQIDTIIERYLEVCDARYSPAGEYCYINNLQNAYQFKTRSILRFAEHGESKMIDVPEQLDTIIINRISNKDILDSGCIKYDTFRLQQLALKEPPGDNETIKVTTQIPATEIIGLVETYMPISLEPCQKKIVISGLFERGYLTTKEPDNLTFYEALVQFQLDAEQHLGLISLTLIALLR